jgi:hypothetical protein
MLWFLWQPCNTVIKYVCVARTCLEVISKFLVFAKNHSHIEISQFSVYFDDHIHNVF